MKHTRKLFGALLIVAMVSLVFWLPADFASTSQPGGRSASAAPPAAKVQQEAPQFEVTAGDPVTPVLTAAARDLPPSTVVPTLDREVNPRISHDIKIDPDFRVEGGPDPLLPLQEAAPPAAPNGFDTPIFNFNGQGYQFLNPPDTNGDVGADHYIQMINATEVAIYNKVTGALVQSFSLTSLGGCATGGGDPIVLYDQMADRWLLSEFGPGNSLCVFISQTGDPTGSYYSYQFTTPSFPDYPKYSVWPDAYYATASESSPSAIALNRAQMIAGQPATSQRFTASGLPGFSFEALTPADLDGLTPPPAGSPGYFMRHRDTEVHGPAGYPSTDLLEIFAFQVDWATPTNSTFTQLPSIETAEFDSDLCGLSSFYCMGMPGVPQGSTSSLDPLREVIMHRLAYRNFGDHETLVGNFVTDVNGNDLGGVRWFELRKSSAGGWSLYQEGTYSVDDQNRWMGAIAMDGSGNIALGYNVSGSQIYPSLRYVGRLAGDPLGTMPQGEYTLIDGTGVNGSNRYGDYASMSIDPYDDCTFWFTGEWNATSQWSTRIGAFRFDSCGGNNFSLSTEPAAQEICVGSDADYAVTVTAISNFMGDVSLAAAGNPGTATFVPNPVTPTDVSMLTISGAAAGSYTFDVVGTSVMTPSLVHTNTVGLDVAAAVPTAPTLLMPPDGATGVPTSPTFTWSAVAGASSYSIEIATDAAFTNIVDSASGIVGTSYTPAASLDPNSTYYWHVSADNACGTGSFSATFSFTTADIVCSTPNLPIPDSGQGQAVDTISVASGGTLTDLDVYLNVPHTWVGDLAFSLQHGATTATIINRPGNPGSTFGCSGNDYDVTVNDEGPDTPIENQCADSPAISGDAPGGDPPGPVLAAFDGQSFAGDWTLTITDNAGGDTGTLVEWCLIPTTEGGNEPPNIDVNPLSLESAQSTNTQVIQQLDVGNTGDLDLTWTIDEEDTTPAYPDALTSSAERLGPTAPSAVQSGQDAPDVDVVQDGGFEAGTPNPFWNEASTNFGTPICDVPSCGTGTGTGPHTGAFWTWFGGIATFEEGSVSQVVTIPSGGTATLSFWVEQFVCDSGADYLEATVDGTQVWVTTGADPACGVLGYRQETVDVSAWADGGLHTLEFHSEIFANSGGGSNFFLDDVVLDATQQTQPCSMPSDIPWLSVNPDNGITAGGATTQVDVTFDSTGLATGVYTGNLCVSSNDPDPGPGNGTDLVVVPVTLTVQPPTAVALTDLVAGESQSPVPVGVPLGALPAAAVAAFAAAYALRRRR